MAIGFHIAREELSTESAEATGKAVFFEMKAGHLEADLEEARAAAKAANCENQKLRKALLKREAEEEGARRRLLWRDAALFALSVVAVMGWAL